MIRISPRSAARSLVALALAVAAWTAPVYASAAEITHVVAKGQTLGRIAKRYHTTVQILREVNDIRPGQRLRPGLLLVIPEKGKEKEAAKRAAALRAARSGDGGAKPGREAADAPDLKRRGDKSKAKGKASADKDPPETVGKYAKKPKRAGLVHLLRGTDKLDAQLLSRGGRLVPAALPGLSRMLRHGPSGAKIAIDPRLATLLGMVSDHFGGRPIHVVSGFRPYTPTQYTPHSNHNHGRAVDFSIEGVPNTVLRDYCRSFRNAGVGYYPNSTFVHLDVRPLKAYWIDYSRPGEAPRYDSPSAQATADESAGEVESGSKETRGEPTQDTDSSIGNADATDSHPGKTDDMGVSGPSPSPSPSGAPQGQGPK